MTAARGTTGEHFAVERSLLQPLPGKPFKTGRLISSRES